MDIVNKEIEYLLTLLACALNEEPVPSPPVELDFNALFIKARDQQIYSMITPLVAQLSEVPQQEKETWRNYNCSELVRMLAVANDRQLIEADLAAHNINYMFLKGLVIKDYYPKASMRQMSDNDILYDASSKENQIAIYEIMKKHGYEMSYCAENSDDFKKEPYYMFEFHRELFFDESSFYPKFDMLWDNATPSAGYKNKFDMSVNDIYIYSVAHMYKHYISSGCGVRFLADLYVIWKKEKDNLDFDEINNRFQKMGILDFAQKSKDLAISMFTHQKLNAEQIAFLEVFVRDEIYGDRSIGMKRRFDEIKKNKTASKLDVIRYYFSRLFPSSHNMHLYYKELDERPWLLGYYYIKRIYKRGFLKRGRAKKEIQMVREFTKDETVEKE